MLSEVFFSLLISTVSALVLALGRMIYKSKCTVIRCCCCQIDRDTQDETRIDLRSNSKDEDTKV